MRDVKYREVCCLTDVILKNIKRSIKHHIKYFNFGSSVQLDHPVPFVANYLYHMMDKWLTYKSGSLERSVYGRLDEVSCTSVLYCVVRSRHDGALNQSPTHIRTPPACWRNNCEVWRIPRRSCDDSAKHIFVSRRRCLPFGKKTSSQN